MRIRRLMVKDFAGIREADLELGPGLNVLYGPNDLGKSTLAESIRLALLLPHTSSHIDEYVPWTGGQNPVVELTFETEAQRIWRVRKEFRKGGASVLDESRNGVDFDEVERARKVDGRLRELLQWGIPEPGGSAGSKGLPSSFLATVLLSTQSDVSAILSDSLQGDPSATGKERIAAALQAVAQDPLFVALLRDTQARRDAAFTDRGAKKTARGSVFKDAADRLRETRDEKERLQTLVDDSEGVERQLHELNARRDDREIAVAAAARHRDALDLLLAQSAAHVVAAEQVRLARVEVERIRQLGADAAAAERAATVMAAAETHAGQALDAARESLTRATAALEAAGEAARAAGTDSTTTATVVRQNLELRLAAADQAARITQQQIDTLLAAQGFVEAAEAADAAQRARQAETGRAHGALAEATVRERASAAHLGRLDLLERAIELRAADRVKTAALADVDTEALLRSRIESDAAALDFIVKRRAALDVPAAAALAPMRKLAHELASARGALNVGLVVTVTPTRTLTLSVDQDGAATAVQSISAPLEIEADAEVTLDLDVATVQVRGGRARAQQAMRSLERRWQREVVPYLTAAGVKEVDALSALVDDARALDASSQAKGAELAAVRAQLGSLTGASAALKAATARVEQARESLGGIDIDSLTTDLAALGADAAGTLRQRRQQVSAELDAVRARVGQADVAHSLAEERSRISIAVRDAAAAARDTALVAYPEGLAATLAGARATLAAALEEQARMHDEAAALERTIAAEAARIAAAVSGAQATEQRARAVAEAAQQALTRAVADHASQAGRLEELRRQRDAQDLAGAEKRLLEATDRLARLPAPARSVTDQEVAGARQAEARTRSDLERTVHEIQRTHGALEQVGGAVARERLRDAIEAFDAAERRERELESEYEAWLLLLQQMKEADAAQASNLGQTLAPAIAGRFEALTQQRYENVRLTAQLGTEGVVVDGALRATERMSVGTREQLSTLYRLSLAEYLKTCVVLDDQLVQSDAARMVWFRDLLTEKAQGFQIIVFTCRPRDYLSAGAMVPRGRLPFKETDGGLTMAVDLERAIQRR